MSESTPDSIIDSFLKNVRLFWQFLFLGGVLIYGLSFLFYLNNRPPVRELAYYKILDLTSFGMALLLALTIFRYKRKYFSLRALRLLAEKLFSENPEQDETGLTRGLTLNLRSRLKAVWLMGSALILLGVIIFWWTYNSRNMNVYFVVGLYSLVMNYPRKDLFLDVPYLVREIVKKQSGAGK